MHVQSVQCLFKILRLPESKTRSFLLVWCSLLPLPPLHHYSPSKWQEVQYILSAQVYGSQVHIMELIVLTSCSSAGTAFSKSPLPIPSLAMDLKIVGYT